MSLKAIGAMLGRNEILLPVLKKYLLQLDKKGHHEAVKRDALMAVKCFKTRYEEYNHGDDPEGEFFHPSAIGMCMRNLWFSAKKAPVDLGPSGEDALKSHITFEIGTYAHVLFQNLCEQAGVLEAREVTICDKNEKVLGHADGILKIDSRRRLLEIKTINSRGFTSLNAPKDAHARQMRVYMKCLKLSEGIIIYIDKDRSVLKEYLVKEDMVQYKTEIRPRMDRFFKHCRENTAPDKEGTSPTSMPCLYCPYTRVCFDTFRFKAFAQTLGVKPKLKLKMKKSV